jgi:hypothetical protein
MSALCQKRTNGSAAKRGSKNAAPCSVRLPRRNLSLSALGNIRTESLRAFLSADMLKIVAKML